MEVDALESKFVAEEVRIMWGPFAYSKANHDYFTSGSEIRDLLKQNRDWNKSFFSQNMVYNPITKVPVSSTFLPKKNDKVELFLLPAFTIIGKIINVSVYDKIELL